MNIQSYAIFQKDFKLLSRHAASALMVQALIMALVPLLYSYLNSTGIHIFVDWNINKWFHKVQIAITCLIALIAAAHFMAEERSGNNVLLLKRLPVSWMRIFSEKLAAGFSIVIAVCLIQLIWFLVTLLFGIKLWEAENKIFAYMLSISIFAYIIGVMISSKVKQTITVLLNGMLIVVISTIMAQQYASQNKIDAYYFFPVFLLVLAIPFGIGMGILKLRHTLHSNIRFRTDQLIRLQLKQNWLYLLLGALFFIVAIIGFAVSSEEIVSSSIAGSVILSIFIGISTYKNNEKHGQQNVLYYQPISLSEIFWTKWLSGFALALMPALCITFSLIGMNNPHGINNSNELGIFLLLPLIGLGPFACAALFTHAIRNTLYAFLECIPAFIIASFIFYYLQFSAYPIIAKAALFSGVGYDLYDMIPRIPGILIALFTGFVLAAWRTATDRSVLTGTTLYRQLYVGRIFFFMLAVVVIIFKIGWDDMFYLLTGIDLGIG